MTPRYPSLRRLASLWVAAALTLLAACGGGGGGGSGSGSGGAGGSCGETARKQWVLDVTRSWYLFQDTLPANVNLGSYATAEDLLDALTATARAQGKDRFFSYLTTQAADNSLLGEGQFIGFGFRTRTDNGNQPYITDVFGGSPASDAGLQRGDEIVAVDDGSGFVPVSQSLVGGKTISDLLGPSDAGVQRGLRILRNGQTFDVSLTKRTVTIDPVPDDFGVKILPLPGTTGVAYLHLRSYISTADTQLRNAFDYFRAQNVQYFIIDLRYNGGGLISTADVLDNLLGGARSAQDVMYKLLYNASKSNQDSTVRFSPEQQSVAPVRIAFLTTDATASASELDINAIRPYVETAIVGSNTYGKPVGQLAFDLQGCSDRMRLIGFRMVNADDQGDYYTGLAPLMRYACAAPDTLTTPLGDARDSLTSEALHWLSTGSCTTPMTAAAPGLGANKPGFAGPSPYPLPLRPSNGERWLPGLQ
jgi:C-terminal processing protease CtpA/Prc